jgi:hypothetical protein
MSRFTYLDNDWQSTQHEEIQGTAVPHLPTLMNMTLDKLPTAGSGGKVGGRDVKTVELQRLEEKIGSSTCRYFFSAQPSTKDTNSLVSRVAMAQDFLIPS